MRFGINRHVHAPHNTRPLMLIVICFMFIFLEKNNPIILAGVRQQLLNTSLPILNFLYQPFAHLSQIPDKISTHLDMRKTMRDLKRRNKKLTRTNLRLSTKLVALTSLSRKLKFRPSKLKLAHTSRIIFTTGQPYRHSLVIRGGEAQNVKIGSTIIYRNYLVGRIINTTRSSSLVLLIQDTTSRIPVVTEKSGIQGILSGTGGQELKLMHVISSKKIHKGERLYTTGNGGAFSPNILVGKVARITKNQIFVRTPVRKDTLDFVFIADPPDFTNQQGIHDAE